MEKLSGTLMLKMHPATRGIGLLKSNLRPLYWPTTDDPESKMALASIILAGVETERGTWADWSTFDIRLSKEVI